MAKLRFIHWNAAEAEPRVRRLRELGHHVTFKELDGMALVKAVRANPPDAVVIDFSRLPSHGRDVAVQLRLGKTSRQIPLVVVGGDAEKVERMKQTVPDAVFTSWRGVDGAIQRAIKSPPQDPVVPSDGLAGYSGTPLPKKLGIKAGSTVMLIAAPANFEELLTPLPSNVTFRRRAQGTADLVIWFVKTAAELPQRIRKIGDLIPDGSVWIAWPKQTSGMKTDVTQALIRRQGLDHGLVDFKICAIDDTWSGLRFKAR